VIPSTGEHYTVSEIGPGLYAYVIGDCDDLAECCS
jgi:hypothetical protein